MGTTVAPGPVEHPELNDAGKAVTILRPSMPTGLETWSDSASIATVVPGGPMPTEINGVPFVAWEDRPTTGAGWLACGGTMPDLAEMPLQPKAGKKASAGIVVVEPDGRVWVVHPTNGFGGYDATFPKGRVDPGTSLQATALRECFEESGLRARITGLLGDFERTTTVMRLYTGERVGGTPAECGWESQAVSLVPIPRLASVLNGTADTPIIAALSAR